MFKFVTVLCLANLAIISLNADECVTVKNREKTVSEDEVYVAPLTCAEKKENADSEAANLEHVVLGRPEFRCVNETGHYDIYQCRGSECFCTDCSGEEIEGFSPMHRWEVNEGTCKCARAQAEFMATGMVGLHFRCENKGGHYKKVQCRGSVCKCAHPYHGEFIHEDDLTTSFDEEDEKNCEDVYDELFGEKEDPSWTPGPGEMEEEESSEEATSEDGADGEEPESEESEESQ